VLLAQQHPNLASLPVRAAETRLRQFMFRLGESFAVRMPRSAAAARLLANEQRWLITLSDRLPLQIPVPIRVGQPAFGFPWRWSVVPWLVGATAETSRWPRARRHVWPPSCARCTWRRRPTPLATSSVRSR
jgi:aminoglycoside phosphotransferase (APT) family kinase protein